MTNSEEPAGSGWDDPKNCNDEKEILPGWVQSLFHRFMLILLAVIVFCVSGALIMAASYQFGPLREISIRETRGGFFIHFAIGGLIGLGVATNVYLGKIRKTRI